MGRLRSGPTKLLLGAYCGEAYDIRQAWQDLFGTTRHFVPPFFTFDIAPFARPSTLGLLGRDGATGLVFATWWQRVGATLIDGLVLTIPLIILYFLFATRHSVLYVLLSIVMEGAYLIWYLSRPAGQTVGNRVANTRVVDATTGQPLDVSRSFKRWFVMALINFSVYVVVGLVLGPLDILWPLWDARRQTLHDKFAGTIVVKI